MPSCPAAACSRVDLAILQLPRQLLKSSRSLHLLVLHCLLCFYSVQDHGRWDGPPVAYCLGKGKDEQGVLLLWLRGA